MRKRNSTCGPECPTCIVAAGWCWLERRDTYLSGLATPSLSGEGAMGLALAKAVHIRNGEPPPQPHNHLTHASHLSPPLPQRGCSKHWLSARIRSRVVASPEVLRRR